MNGTFPNSAPAGLPDAGMHVGAHLPRLGRARGSAGVGVVLAPGHVASPHPAPSRALVGGRPILGRRTDPCPRGIQWSSTWWG